ELQLHCHAPALLRQPLRLHRRRLTDPRLRTLGSAAGVEIDTDEELLVDSALLGQPHAPAADHHRPPLRPAALPPPRDPIPIRGQQTPYQRPLAADRRLRLPAQPPLHEAEKLTPRPQPRTEAAARELAGESVPLESLQRLQPIQDVRTRTRPPL